MWSPRRPGPRSTPARRPMLLALVYGVFLVLVGVTATALVTVAATHLSSATLNGVVARDRALVALFVNSNLSAQDVDNTGPSRASANALEAKLKTLIAQDDILRIDLRAADGTILASTASDARGSKPNPQRTWPPHSGESRPWPSSPQTPSRTPAGLARTR